MKTTYKDKDFLAFLYHTEEYSIRDIARISGYSQQTIFKWFKELGIPTRTAAEATRTEKSKAKVRKAHLGKAFNKGIRLTEEHRKNSGRGVKKIRARKRREEKYFHRENILVIEEI